LDESGDSGQISADSIAEVGSARLGNPGNFLGNFALDLLVFWDSTPEERHFAGFLVGVPWPWSVDLASGLSVLRLGPGWAILRSKAKAKGENLFVCGGDLGFGPSVGLGSQALRLFPLEGSPLYR